MNRSHSLFHLRVPSITTFVLAICIGGAFCCSTTTAGVFFSEDFEGYSGMNFDANGFAQTSSDAGSSIPGVIGLIAGNGWNGNVINNQPNVEIADADLSNIAKAFLSGRAADLNGNGLRFDFTLDNDSMLVLEADFGVGSDGSRGLYYELEGASISTITGASPDQVGRGNQSFRTTFDLLAGDYSLALGSTAVNTVEGIHVDNIRLSSVPEPSSIAFCCVAVALCSCHRRKQKSSSHRQIAESTH